MTEEFRGPLSELRVLEFGQVAAGPFAGMLLADLGADVVKVERPGSGDSMRAWPPLIENAEGEEYSGNFASINRNKRSLAIDFKDAEQTAKLQELCTRADVVIENFRPGVLRRLGLGYEALNQVNRRLIYCSISGYGQEGSYAEKGAFDVTVQAMSGLMSVTGEETGSAAKCGVPVGDFVAALYAVYSILAATVEVERSGQGVYIDCSMLGSLLGISALQTSEYFGTGVSPKRLGSAHPRNAPYQGFQASDKPFVVAAGNDKLWRELCDAVGLCELANDPLFATQSSRARNQCELETILQPIFSKRPAEEWLTDLNSRGVPCAPINTFADILADPHIKEMGLIGDMTLPNGTTTKNVGFPTRMTGYRFKVFREPPKLGEHNEEVFEEWIEYVRK